MSQIQSIRHPFHIGFLTFLILFLFCNTGVTAADEWSPVKAGTAFQAEIPPGWSLLSDITNVSAADGQITARSPDMNSRLTYTLESEHGPMTNGEIKEYQSRYMSRLGFRICMTKDPIISTEENSSSYRQTYVRGSDDAAVIGTLQFPDHGLAHYILVMEGPDSVAQYYETLPEFMSEHIKPVSSATS
jgi:hypothetical protein